MTLVKQIEQLLVAPTGLENMLTYNIEQRGEWCAFGSERVVVRFKNKYLVSIIMGEGAHSNQAKPYEIAVLFGNEFATKDAAEKFYAVSPPTDDVIGYLTLERVRELLEHINNLPKATVKSFLEYRRAKRAIGYDN